MNRRKVNRRKVLQGLAASGVLASLGLPFTSAFAQSTGMLSAFGNRRSVRNSLIYAGNLFSILADKKSTGGSYGLMEVTVVQGREAPPHTHSKEDEIFYVLSGEVSFVSGEVVNEAKAGDMVFQPRGVLHSFKVKTPSARMLILFTPGGLEEAYQRLGTAAQTLTTPTSFTPPSPADLGRILGVFGEYGLTFPPPRS